MSVEQPYPFKISVNNPELVKVRHTRCDFQQLQGSWDE